jgi:hypothetical protein
MKVDESSLQSLKFSDEKVRNDFKGAIIDMYAHLHLFQDATVIVINKKK